MPPGFPQLDTESWDHKAKERKDFHLLALPEELEKEIFKSFYT